MQDIYQSPSMKPKHLDAYLEDTFQLLQQDKLPWSPQYTSNQLQKSLASGDPFSGGNQIVLAVRSALRQFPDPYWATYNAIRKMG